MNKKILKKLGAAALVLGLGTSLMISASAMSPKSLCQMISNYQSKKQIMKMEEELRRNGFDDSNIKDVKDALNPNGQKVDYAKALILSKLSVSQEKIQQIKSYIQAAKLNLDAYYQNFSNNAAKYSNNTMICQLSARFNQHRLACLASAKAILDEDHSLKAVQMWKNMFDKSYTEAQKKIKEANEYISHLNMQKPFNNFNNFGSFGFNNFQNPGLFGFNNMPNSFNNFGFFKPNNMLNNNFNNMPNNFNNVGFGNNVNRPNNAQNQITNNNVRRAPIVQNNVNNGQTKKELEERFRRIASGKQPWSGPCWLYATTTAINEFRDRNGLPLIKTRDDIENECKKKGFANPFSTEGGGGDDIVNYARKQGLDAVHVIIEAHDNFNFSKEDSIKFVTLLLRRHFEHSKSPVLIKKVLRGNLHEMLIAGIVGGEFLVVDSWDNSVRWHPIKDLSEYYVEGQGDDNGFDLVFVRDKKEGQQEFQSLYMLYMTDINLFKAVKKQVFKLACNF